MKKDNLKLMWEAEHNQAELKVLSTIDTVRNILDNLEHKIKDGITVYDSDGLQANGIYLDTYLTKMVTIQKAIEGLDKID